MNITENKSEGLVKSFKVVVAADEFKAAYDKKLAETATKVKLPGFRPGNTPIGIVEQKYGQAVKGDAAEALIQDASSKIVMENKLRLAVAPKVDVAKFEDGQDFEFSIEFEVLPEIGSVDLSKVSVEKPTAQVSDEEVEKALKRLADARKSTEVINEDRLTKEGDVVVIDFVGTINGEEFRGGSGKDFYLALGSNTFIPGFEPQLVSKKIGETVNVNVTFPAEYHVKDLAGKEAVFATTLKELRQYKEAEVNDEFAKTFGQETLDGLKNVIKEELAKEYANVSNVHLKRAILDALAPVCSFDAPQSMVDMEFDAIWKQFENAKARGQLDEDEKNASEEDLKAEYKAIAVRRVKLGLLLAEIANQNKITLDAADIQKAISAEAARNPGYEKQVFEFYQKNPKAMEALRAPLFEEKVVDFVSKNIQITEKVMTPEELYAFDPDKK
ncbi:MAG: trigger factor [Alphaproteobacteria bacterium]|nr:trigger factor [Alphaproteobacteria bacterium]